MIDAKFAKQDVVRRLQEGLQQTPKPGASFAEHINSVLDTASAELRPEGLFAFAEQPGIDAFVSSLRPAVTSDAASYKRKLANSVLQAYRGDIHLCLSKSFDALFTGLGKYDPTLEALRPPPLPFAALTPPEGYQDLLGLSAKVAPKSLLDRLFGNTFQIPS